MKVARENFVIVHNMTLSELPKFETYEEVGQIRRSVKSVRSNIIEVYESGVKENFQVTSDQ